PRARTRASVSAATCPWKAASCVKAGSRWLRKTPNSTRAATTSSRVKPALPAGLPAFTVNKDLRRPALCRQHPVNPAPGPQKNNLLLFRGLFPEFNDRLLILRLLFPGQDKPGQRPAQRRPSQLQQVILLAGEENQPHIPALPRRLALRFLQIPEDL